MIQGLFGFISIEPDIFINQFTLHPVGTEVSESNYVIAN